MREVVTWVEVDLERCARRWGVGACTAALSAAAPAKCFGSIATCPVDAFMPEVMTLRFIDPRGPVPMGEIYYPALTDVSARSATVNLAGSDARLSSLGRRATVKVTLADFEHHDRGIDPYQAERVTGAAQFSGVGYDPARGTFFGKLKARWPYYSGRALRVKTGEMRGGAVVNVVTRAYVISDWSGPSDSGVVVIEGKDILSVADNARAVAPALSGGYLTANITATDTALTLTPEGIGDLEYPPAGRVRIGSECADFTRAGDVLTLTARGVAGTSAAGHNARDSAQLVLRFNAARVDDVLRALLVDFAGVPAEFIPTAEWAAERARWLADLKLTTDITAPVGVAALVGELADLGVSIWWDDVAQKIRIKANRPPDDEPIYDLNDDAHIIGIQSDDRNEDRLTEIQFFTVQIDPTKSATDAANFLRMTVTYDFEAKAPERYGDTRARKIYSRWLNSGADQLVGLLAARLLMRFSAPPQRIKARVDAKDRAIGLTDVVRLQTASIVDATGRAAPRLMQVIEVAEVKGGREVELTLQAYPFSARFGFSTEDARPDYDGSTEDQRAAGAYAIGPSLKFADGSGPFVAI